MSSSFRFAADSDFIGERCTVRFDHSGNLTLAPPEPELARARPLNKDPATTDFISPAMIESVLPPACVTYIVSAHGEATLGQCAQGSGSGGLKAGDHQQQAGALPPAVAVVNLNGLDSAGATPRAGEGVGSYRDDLGLGSGGRGGGASSGGSSRKSLLTIFFQSKSNLVSPSVPLSTQRVNFLSKLASKDPPPKTLVTPELLRLVQGPEQDSCPYELRARNIEPRIHIAATANNSICTYSASLQDALLFDQNGSVVNPSYSRAFGVLSSMNFRQLSPTSMCMSYMCALSTPEGEVLSPPSSPLAKHGSPSASAASAGSSAYSPYGLGGANSTGGTGNTAPSFLSQHYSTSDEGALRHRVLEEALQQIANDYTHATAAFPAYMANPKARDGAARAKISWRATKAKDDALIRASKYTATIAFEPILLVGVNTGSINVISLSSQKELFRFNTVERGKKVIDGFACSAIESVHCTAQSSVTAVLKAAHGIEGKLWSSSGSGSTRNFTPRSAAAAASNAGSVGAGAGGGGGHATAAPTTRTSGSSIRDEAMGGSDHATALGGSVMSSPSDTPIRSVYAAGFDNGEVLLISLSMSNGEMLRKVSYGTRPITSIRVGCLPWELHIPHAYSKQNGRNFHKPNDVNGSGSAACGRGGFFQLVWQQRDEMLFEMTHPSDVQRLVGPPAVVLQGDHTGGSTRRRGGNNNKNGGDGEGAAEVSLTPPRSPNSETTLSSIDDTSSATTINALGGGGRYDEEDVRNEPLNSKLGASPSPQRRPSQQQRGIGGVSRVFGGGYAQERSAVEALPFVPKPPSAVPYTSMPQNEFGTYAIPQCYLSTAQRLSTAAFLRRVAFWNNFAIVTTAAGVMHVVATSLSDAGERAEVRTLEEISMRSFKSFGTIVTSELLFSISPGSLLHAECVRRDPAADRQQVAFLALTTQSNNILLLRLSFSMTEDIRPFYGVHNTISSVAVALVAKRDVPHTSYINSLAVTAIPNKAFGFAGVCPAFVGENGHYTFGAAEVAANTSGGRGPTNSSFATPYRAGTAAAVGRSNVDSFNHRSSIAVGISRSGALDGGLFGLGGIADGQCGQGGGYYEPLMPFMLAALGIDQKITFWVCEASLDPPVGFNVGGNAAGGGLFGYSPDGALSRTRSDRASRTAIRNSTTTYLMRNGSFAANLNGTVTVVGGAVTPPQVAGGNLVRTTSLPAATLAGTSPGAVGGWRLPISFNISQEEAMSVKNNNPKDCDPWSSLSSCGVDGHQTFMCLSLRGSAKVFDCEIEENCSRAAFRAAAAAAASRTASHSASTKNN